MSRNNGLWVALPCRAFQDPRFAEGGKDAELVYYRSLQLAKLLDDDDHIPSTMLNWIMRGVRSQSAVVTHLVRTGLWSSAGPAFKISQLSRTAGGSTAAEVQRKQQRDIRQDMVKPQREAKVGADGGTGNGPRGGAHGLESKQRESFRSPSGSDRKDSARDEPRVAGGAARPAPEAESAVDGMVGDQGPGSATVVGLGELSGPELVKANIRKTRSTGKPAQFRQPEWQQRRNEPSPFETAMGEIAKRLPGGEK